MDQSFNFLVNLDLSGFDLRTAGMPTERSTSAPLRLLYYCYFMTYIMNTHSSTSMQIPMSLFAFSMAILGDGIDIYGIASYVYFIFIFIFIPWLKPSPHLPSPLLSYLTYLPFIYVS